MTAGRIRLAACAAAILALATALAWVLAHPQLSPAMTAVRAVADCAAVLSLGLAVAPRLEDQRYREDLAGRTARLLVAAAAVWSLAELVRLALSAAQAAAIPPSRLSLRTAVEFATSTTPGRSGMFSLAAALLVCALAVVVTPSESLGVAAAGVAASGLAAHALIGHLADSTVGAVAVAVHALAGALWCGTLAALAVTVTARGQWSRVLPRFSQMSLYCLCALLAGGIAGALITMDSVGALIGTDYGRMLLAKVCVTVLLLVLAWRNRSSWLPAARAHRISAARSRTRSLAEVALMVVALTLAAGLTVTG
ncbi:CopD family protein [soil metagenome]